MRIKFHSSLLESMSVAEETMASNNTSEVEEVDVVTLSTNNLSLSRHSSHDHVSSLAIYPHSPNESNNPSIRYPDYRDIPVREVMESRPVITIEHNRPMEQAFEVHFLAKPAVSRTSRDVRPVQILTTFNPLLTLATD